MQCLAPICQILTVTACTLTLYFTFVLWICTLTSCMPINVAKPFLSTWLEQGERLKALPASNSFDLQWARLKTFLSLGFIWKPLAWYTGRILVWPLPTTESLTPLVVAGAYLKALFACSSMPYIIIINALILTFCSNMFSKLYPHVPQLWASCGMAEPSTVVRTSLNVDFGAYLKAFPKQ